MTVLIIGGAFQGKRKIAEKLYPELPKVFNLHEIVRKCIADGRDSMTLLDELRGFCFMWAENYNFHEVKEFRCMNWAKGKRRTLVPERASQGGF